MHQPKQLQLFELFVRPEIKAIYDPYWDEITKSDIVREQLSTSAPEPTNTVREQVNSDTAPEHNSTQLAVVSDTNQLHTHWTEKYWVKRRGEKYEYYRYCYMEGRKIYHCHIGGRAGSIGAIQRIEAVAFAINDGESPQEIKLIIRGFTS